MGLTDPVRRYSACVEDRYPELFEELASIAFKNKTILSYGCGMGQELLTIRKYAPTALVYGVDINPEAVVSARELTKNDNHIVVMDAAELPELRTCANAPVIDCVLAMNVFKRQSSRDFGHKEYTREEFRDDILELTEFLRPLGFLVVDGIQYQIMDIPELAEKFAPMHLDANEGPRREFHPTDRFFFSKYYLFQKVISK